jgi:hypothetical protein
MFVTLLIVVWLLQLFLLLLLLSSSYFHLKPQLNMSGFISPTLRCFHSVFRGKLLFALNIK